MKKRTKLHLNFPKGRIRNVRFSTQFRTQQMMEINKLGLNVSGACRKKKVATPSIQKRPLRKQEIWSAPYDTPRLAINLEGDLRRF